MPSQSNKSQRPNVQTDFHAQSPDAAPASAISASSGASNSQHGSPTQSPRSTILTVATSIHASPTQSPRSTMLTVDTSIHASPDLMPDAADQESPEDLEQLPGPIISPKTSRNSLGSSVTGSPSAPSETVYSNSSSRASRRLSNKGRRQSSAASSSRETSAGPSLWRKRSDSNSTAPEYGVADSDSGSENAGEDNNSFRQPFIKNTLYQDSPPMSTSASISSGSNTTVGPVIPLQLRQGTPLKKISKKNRSKRINLIYDTATNKMMWDASRPQKFLHVDEIIEIRTGSDIEQYARDFGVQSEERSNWFTIIYAVPEKSKSKFLHLVANSKEIYSVWVTFLEAMLKHRQEVMASLMTFDEKAIKQYWGTEMMKHNSEDQEELDITGVMRVCQNLHIHSSQSTLQSNFRLADARQNEKLNYDEFLEFVRLMRQRQEVHRLIQGLATRPYVGLTFEEFFSFLRDVQKEDVSDRDKWQKIFDGLVRNHRNDDTSATVTLDELNTLSETAFTGFLSSKQFNLPTIDEQREFTLDRPMNEYFISSSHNTYLLGRQVAGQSSIEGYITALLRGCRCVEVDCWDGPGGSPIVVHGRTLTSAIGFLEVMNTINKYAFAKSKFPLWISLEVHCNPTQQAIMAGVIRDTFGEKLVTEPVEPDSSKLPSPSKLMERILIKVKQPRTAARSETMGSDSLMGMGRKRGNSVGSVLARSSTTESNTTAATTQSLPQSPTMAPINASRKFTGNSQKINTINEGRVQELNSDSDSGGENGSIKALSNIIPDLGKLGVYCTGLKFSGFEAPAAKKFNHIFSFMESSFAKNSKTKEEKMQLNIHNMRYLMRVYPDGTRLTSSNFDPLAYWRRGVQMAALNWQTFDMGMQVNQAMFEGGTDSSGYVLKPQELRDIQVYPKDDTVSAAIAEGKKERTVVSFSIDVVSAQQLMRPANLPANKSMDFYVDVDVFHANDKRNKKDKDFDLGHEPDSPLRRHTEVIRENGFNPMFSNGQFHFKVTTKHPELIFVRWSVRLANDGDYNNSAKDKPAMASYTAKLTNLKNGYRTLPLLNHAGEQYLFSSLFCKIDIDPFEKKFIDVPRPAQEGGSKLNRLGGIFGRSNNTSPRSTIERSSMEKNSFEMHSPQA
ncbi:putative phospholipase C [Trichoderma atroviride IMI 206040]|uniref:Phosphoinositide phospholipase C n=1 Tax=Hypocrea atroviridis (strain ATCC 20476 / IMI 206040) TaxID=452589 RepID=G9P473_HYPAI|nr:putative phospholipase C [Trichoderma atroviride IMI 206040]EHK41917.1 putative phospholipase C [Trichoderma atroviride IMI 206040]